MHELKTYRGVISNDTEKWWKIWRGIDLSFQNWHNEFDKFWLENSEVLEIYTLMGCFRPKYIKFELKKYRGAIFHDTRVWCKIWRKTDLRNLAICQQSKWNSQNWHFHWILLYKSKKFEIELTCHFKIDMRNLTNFYPSTQKSQKFAL